MYRKICDDSNENSEHSLQGISQKLSKLWTSFMDEPLEQVVVAHVDSNVGLGVRTRFSFSERR
jgi:hypothetical protein